MTTPQTTSDKYLSALIDLKNELTRKRRKPFVMSRFIREHGISNRFADACVALDIIRVQPSRKKFKIYTWANSLLETPDLLAAKAVRDVVGLKTNGNAPKIERKEKQGSRRKKKDHPKGKPMSHELTQWPEHLHDEIRRHPENFPRPGGGTSGVGAGMMGGHAFVDSGAYSPEAWRRAMEIQNEPPVEMRNNRQPFDADKIVQDVKSSIFHRLCPECAATLHHLIDLITKA